MEAEVGDMLLEAKGPRDCWNHQKLVTGRDSLPQRHLGFGLLGSRTVTQRLSV